MKTIMINDSIYYLERFCRIRLNKDANIIAFYIDNQKPNISIKFDTKEECLSKWNEIYHSLH